MALQGSPLDIRPQTEEEKTDPRIVRLMQQYNIWHPGLKYPIGSKRAAEEADILSHIQTLVSHQDQLAESQAQRREIHGENLAQRRDYQAALTEDRAANREARAAAQGEAAATRRAGMLQLMASDPSLSPEEKKAVRGAMLETAGIQVPTGAAAPATAAKGEYGPGGAPQPSAAVAPPTRQAPIPGTRGQAFNIAGTTTPPMAGPGAEPALPVMPRDNPATSLESMAQLAPRGPFSADPFNWMAYKRDIGGANFAKIYGTDEPAYIKGALEKRGGLPPAQEIPDIYKGTPTIPDVSPVGYYDKAGKFLGPAYNEQGGKLPMPKGATGLHGTAALPGVTYDPSGAVSHVAPEAREAIAGRVPITSSAPQGVPGPYGEANKPTTEAMLPTPVQPPAPGTYAPPTQAFTAPPEVAAAAAPTPAVPYTPEQGLAHQAVNAALSFLLKKGAPFGPPQQPTPPPAVVQKRRDYY